MNNYQFKKIERKWQEYWEKNKFYRAKDPAPSVKRRGPKKYIMIEFPYPSGDGLHVGHVRSYSALDALARKKRMEGFNVLYPIGWDAFGLPTENYAIKKGIHPSIITKRNIAIFKRQLKSLGLSFDWSREINTSDPNYYKWTQWIFLQFFKHGLAYQAVMPINWCPKCKIGLANEEVIAGKCERCGAETEKRNIKQWLLKITKYADRLIDDLSKVDFLPKIKNQQINWIGRSEGTTIKFKVQSSKFKVEEEFIEVFTTRVDTLFGVTALVIAPEHELIKNLKFKIKNWDEVEKYIKEAAKKKEIERTAENKEKTGVKLDGIYAINPANNEKIPVWVGDYVVATYGGGAVMVVPAHDKRDWQFAKKYNLEIREVVVPIDSQKSQILPPYGGTPPKAVANPKSQTNSKIQIPNSKPEEAFTEDGILINSGRFNGLTSEKAREEITKWLEEKKWGKKTIQYKLRDWIFSRQHYWGEPIPLIFCDNCRKKLMANSKSSRLTAGPRQRRWQILNPKQIKNFNKGELLNPGWIAVPEADLPVKLPYVKKYKPTKTGESPLANIKEWVNAKCPKCGGPAKRETDTMPNWAGSSWYYLAYLIKSQIPKSKSPKYVWNKKKIKYWLPVDLYNGGMEHTTLHLLYSRFWHKFLYDLKLVPTPEPYAARRSHGMVLAADGRKMSKSFGNVINPDDIVKNFGADTLRMYEMFMGPFDQAINWSNQGVVGVFRFLNRIFNLKSKILPPCGGTPPKAVANPKSQTPKESAKADPTGQANPKSKIQNQKLETLLHRSIKKISEDLENMKFNTAVSQLMIFVNELEKESSIDIEIYKTFLKLLAPFAPHLAEELWHLAGEKKSIHLEKWPAYDPEKIKEEIFELVIQVNGKVRATVSAPIDVTEEQAKELALSQERIKSFLSGKTPRKVIFIPGRLINIVV